MNDNKPLSQTPRNWAPQAKHKLEALKRSSSSSRSTDSISKLFMDNMFHHPKTECKILAVMGPSDVRNNGMTTTIEQIQSAGYNGTE